MKVVRVHVVAFTPIIPDSFYIILKVAFNFTHKATLQPLMWNTFRSCRYELAPVWLQSSGPHVFYIITQWTN